MSEPLGQVGAPIIQEHMLLMIDRLAQQQFLIGVSALAAL
jgi:hypothetical protein